MSDMNEQVRDMNAMTDRASWILPGDGVAEFDEKPAWHKYVRWALIAVGVAVFIWLAIDCLFLNPIF